MMISVLVCGCFVSLLRFQPVAIEQQNKCLVKVGKFMHLSSSSFLGIVVM